MRRRRSGINPRAGGTPAAIMEVAPPLFLKPHKNNKASRCLPMRQVEDKFIIAMRSHLQAGIINV